ncbi:MAG: RDD family protein [Chloroflexi bacterium]|nr:MAG: RDD family protein [Chloroflexota bacterium]
MSEAMLMQSRARRQAQPAYAGFWLRLAAYLIDFMLLSVVELVLALGYLLMNQDLKALLVVKPDTYSTLLVVVYLVANVAPVWSAVGWAYFAVLESSPLQGTVGKHALGLYVTDVQGDPIGFRRASLRYWLKAVSDLTLAVGWIMAAFTPRKQALHDLLAGTLVLRRVQDSTPVPAAASLAEYWDGSRWVSSSSITGEV